MKRINPLLTSDNPAPIPGCHATRRLLRTVLWLSRLHLSAPKDSPCVMTTEVLDIRPGISVSHPPKVDKAYALEAWLWEDKVLSTTDCQQGLLPHVPQRRDDWDKGFKDKVYHIVTQHLYQYVLEKGDNVLKTMSTTFVTHQRPPRYSLLPDS
jgi:hypothetical protein